MNNYTVTRVNQWGSCFIAYVQAKDRTEAMREAKKTLGKQRILDIKWVVKKDKES